MNSQNIFSPCRTLDINFLDGMSFGKLSFNQFPIFLQLDSLVLQFDVYADWTFTCTVLLLQDGVILESLPDLKQKIIEIPYSLDNFLTFLTIVAPLNLPRSLYYCFCFAIDRTIRNFPDITLSFWILSDCNGSDLSVLDGG